MARVPRPWTGTMMKRAGLTTSAALVRVAGRHRLALAALPACLLMACATTGDVQAQDVGTGPTATSSAEVPASYPGPLHGHWMPKDVACPSPIDYDSDVLIVIDKERLAHYEDGNKPVRVRQVAAVPQVWVVESLLNVAGEGYDTPVTEVFVLSGTGLTIVGDEQVETYRKCD